MCINLLFSMAPQNARETIGRTLSYQYEMWQAKAKYKIQLLDPTVEEVKKLYNTCSKYAKSEGTVRSNGHGVPKPTANGEIWLFNKVY